MTRPQLARVVEEWRAALLPEWRVILHDEPPEDADVESAWATCNYPDDYLKLNIHFTDELLKTQSNEEIEATVVHELLHALTRPWRKQLDSVSFELGNAKTSVLRQQAEHEEEKMIDRLAYLLAGQAHGVEPCRTLNGTEVSG